VCVGRGITGTAEDFGVNSRKCVCGAIGQRVVRQAGGSMAGLTSTTGVPSIASRASASIRSPSRATMRAWWRPMGFGRLGKQVLNTPCLLGVGAAQPVLLISGHVPTFVG
jgi:hypothetical protein